MIIVQSIKNMFQAYKKLSMRLSLFSTFIVLLLTYIVYSDSNGNQRYKICRQIFIKAHHSQIFFKVGEVSWNQGNLINISSKAQEKKAPQRKVLEFFLLNTFKPTFSMGNLTQRWSQSGTFFSKIRTIFLIFKKGQERPPSSPLPC